jgi:hypothetical protein
MKKKTILKGILSRHCNRTDGPTVFWLNNTKLEAALMRELEFGYISGKQIHVEITVKVTDSFGDGGER